MRLAELTKLRKDLQIAEGYIASFQEHDRKLNSERVVVADLKRQLAAKEDDIKTLESKCADLEKKPRSSRPNGTSCGRRATK